MPAAWLTVVEGSRAGERFSLARGETRLGSGPRCDVFLPSEQYPGLADTHALITWDGETCLVDDLGGARRVILNGNPVSSARLQDGDTLTLGDLALGVTIGEAAEDEPVPASAVPPAVAPAPPVVAAADALSPGYQVVQADGAVTFAVPIGALREWVSTGRLAATSVLRDPVSGQVFQAGALPVLQSEFARLPAAPPVHADAQRAGRSALAGSGLGVAIAAASVAAVGFFPCLGWLNWAGVPLALCAGALCLASIVTEKRNQSAMSQAIVGLVVAFGAFGLGMLRLMLGGGCL